MFAKSLLESLKEKFSNDFENPLICAATILDPRYRDFEPSWMTERVKQLQLDITPQGKIDWLAAKRTQDCWRAIHQAHGQKMLLNAIEFVYAQFGYLDFELEQDAALFKAKNPIREREVADGNRDWLLKTTLGKVVFDNVDSLVHSFSRLPSPCSFLVLCLFHFVTVFHLLEHSRFCFV